MSDEASGDAWYALMDADTSPAQLADGVFAGRLTPTAARAPERASNRAGVEVGGTGPGPVAAASLLALVAAVAAACCSPVLRRRREALL